MTTYVQELENCFLMNLSKILASDLLDDYNQNNEQTLLNFEISDVEMLSITYMYEIKKQECTVNIYDENNILTSTHIFHDRKIKLTDEIAMKLVDLVKQMLEHG